MSERTYTESELAVERAALLREAARSIADVPYAATTKQYIDAIMAIPTNQSALERYEDKLVAEFTAGNEAMKSGFLDRLARVEAAAYARAKQDAAAECDKRLYAGTRNTDLRDAHDAILALEDCGREAEK